MWHIFHASVSIFRCSCACMLSCFSGVRLFVTLWTVACQAPLSIILTLFRDQRSLKPRTLRHTLKLTDKKKKKKKKKEPGFFSQLPHSSSFRCKWKGMKVSGASAGTIHQALERKRFAEHPAGVRPWHRRARDDLLLTLILWGSHHPVF